MGAAAWSRQPLAHFLSLGLLLFAGDLWRTGASPRKERLVISAARVEALREEARTQGGVPAGDRTLDGLVAAVIEEELLVREALRLGLDRSDQVVRERLVLDLRFLGAEGTDEDLVARARELGLEEGDPMVRRRLVELMSERIMATAAARPTPGESELVAFYEAHVAELEKTAQVRFHHVFVEAGAGVGDAAAQQRAVTLLHDLERDGRGAAAGDGGGDDFVFGPRESWRSREELAKLYGGELADAIWSLPERHWSGPVSSNWGLHLVWVDERRAGRRPPLEEIRSEVEEHVRAECFSAERARKLELLSRRYEIVVEAPR